MGCWLTACSLVAGFGSCGWFGDLNAVCGVLDGCLRAFGLITYGGVLGSGACGLVLLVWFPRLMICLLIVLSITLLFIVAL